MNTSFQKNELSVLQNLAQCTGLETISNCKLNSLQTYKNITVDTTYSDECITRTASVELLGVSNNDVIVSNLPDV